MDNLMQSILEAMASRPGALDSHVIAEGASMAINRIRELEACLRDTREEICRGPVDGTLWHKGMPACTTVDNICMALDDEWDYNTWLEFNSTSEEKAEVCHCGADAHQQAQRPLDQCCNR